MSGIHETDKEEGKYQRLVSIWKGDQGARVQTTTRIHADEPARFVMRLNVIITGLESDGSTHYVG